MKTSMLSSMENSILYRLVPYILLTQDTHSIGGCIQFHTGIGTTITIQVENLLTVLKRRTCGEGSTLVSAAYHVLMVLFVGTTSGYPAGSASLPAKTQSPVTECTPETIPQ